MKKSRDTPVHINESGNVSYYGIIERSKQGLGVEAFNREAGTPLKLALLYDRKKSLTEQLPEISQIIHPDFPQHIYIREILNPRIIRLSLEPLNDDEMKEFLDTLDSKLL